VSKTFGEWYQKTNKTEDTNKLTLLAFKIIAILHNTQWATFIKLLETVSKGLLRNRLQKLSHVVGLPPCGFFLSMPSFGGEVKPFVPYLSFAACKRIHQLYGSRIVWLNLTGHFLPIISPFANRGLSRRLAWSASGDERWN
jgi:hypothetical protein